MCVVGPDIVNVCLQRSTLQQPAEATYAHTTKGCRFDIGIPLLCGRGPRQLVVRVAYHRLSSVSGVRAERGGEQHRERPPRRGDCADDAAAQHPRRQHGRRAVRGDGQEAERGLLPCIFVEIARGRIDRHELQSRGVHV